jgi:hypothetical protein
MTGSRPWPGSHPEIPSRDACAKYAPPRSALGYIHLDKCEAEQHLRPGNKAAAMHPPRALHLKVAPRPVFPYTTFF